ncbi:phosphatase PAP2 family protein [Halpernia sp.]|uniref:phosphatase PAP2 family protein n=1 Tax=Halpernia sp. TaxID=2782209 RepID=UPI003A91CAF8
MYRKPFKTETKKFNSIIKSSALLFILIFNTGFSQKNYPKDSSKIQEKTLKIKQFIFPATLVTAGFISLSNPKLNESIKNNIQEKNSNFHTTIDNYTEFIPGAAVFALNAFGVKGKHNWKDAALIYGTSLAITATVVFSLKSITREQRPDFSDNNSFPSGHTAIAFASAEFLWQEYKNSPWIGFSGYTIAIATGVLRMYNNKHWFGDVLAGAGFGIASAKLSYYLYDKIFIKKGWSFTFYPIYINNIAGFSYVYRF